MREDDLLIHVSESEVHLTVMGKYFRHTVNVYPSAQAAREALEARKILEDRSLMGWNL